MDNFIYEGKQGHHFEQVTTGGVPMDLPYNRADVSVYGRVQFVIAEMSRFRHELAGTSHTLAKRLDEITEHLQDAIR